MLLLGFVGVFYREILSILYDGEFCKLKRINTQLFYVVIFVLVSLGIVMSMSVAGLILVISILSIPAYIAALFAPSLRIQMLLSWIFSLVLMWVGFGFSYALDLSIGACVVVVSVCSLFLVLLLKRMCRRV